MVQKKCYNGFMFRRSWPFAILIILLLLLGGIFKLFSDYRDTQKQRLVKLQEKSAEVQVTILEGWTSEEIADKLEESELFSKTEFLTAVQKYDYSRYPLLADKPPKTSLEGYLFPDTYRFNKDSSPDEVITKFLDNFTKRMNSIGVSGRQTVYTIPGYEDLVPVGGDNQAGMSLYDLLILASVVEKESAESSNYSLAEERGLIAGVFYNRLSIGQALESDATVNYITGKNDPGVSLKDTEINSAYNTYKYAGLPPGPIGNPSLGSIQAVLRPTKSNYLYFLHKQPSGEVQFSKTFAEHIQKKQ